MTDLWRLDLEMVVELNVDLCAETGENASLLDRAGLEAALERPWSGFGDMEAFPTTYHKAAALLHGIAARQVFENGNKRTAWTATMVFLEANGIDLGAVRTVQADMFVRAAALDHSLEIDDLAEWLRTAHEDFESKGSMTFAAYDGERIQTPAGVLEHGLPHKDDVPLGGSMMFRQVDPETVDVFVMAGSLTPENAHRSQADREAMVLAAFRMPARQLASHFKGFTETIAPDLLGPSDPAPGRNAPCPCGSGKKYKHCHGRPESAQ